MPAISEIKSTTKGTVDLARINMGIWFGGSSTSITAADLRRQRSPNRFTVRSAQAGIAKRGKNFLKKRFLKNNRVCTKSVEQFSVFNVR